jgi:hypothetical protein
MDQVPPGSGSAGSDRRRSGALSIRPSTSGPPVSSMFSTGPQATLEGGAADATKRNERGRRIVSEVRRTLLYAVVFLGVGRVLALFVSTLWG